MAIPFPTPFQKRLSHLQFIVKDLPKKEFYFQWHPAFPNNPSHPADHPSVGDKFV